MATSTIIVAKAFSRFPAGRFVTDGPHSGERFRDELLIPALETNPKIKILMDGALGYGSSFLEEAFGGLIRKTKISLRDFQRRVEIVSSDVVVTKEIMVYVSDAARQ